MTTARTTGDSKDPKDPWVMAQGKGYDIDHFYTRSTDGKGHSENVQAKLSPAMLGELQALIAARLFPYKTVQDFIRDAVLHRAKYVSDLIRSGRVDDLGFGPLIAAEAKLMMIEQARERRALAIKMMESHAEEVRALREAGKRGEAWDCVNDFEELMEAWSDEIVYPKMLAAVAEWRQQLAAMAPKLTVVRDVADGTANG